MIMFKIDFDELTGLDEEYIMEEIPELNPQYLICSNCFRKIKEGDDFYIIPSSEEIFCECCGARASSVLH